MGKCLVDPYPQFRPEPHDFRGISLCAGYAGLDLGLHIAEPRYRTVCYVEREAHAAATIVARMEDAALAAAPIWDDLESFNGQPWRGRVHIVTAGYPCQPFSTAGKRRGADDPRHLWPQVARVVEEVDPEWVLCENVEGHLDLGFAEVVECLQGLGRRVKAGLFTARETGARHRRRRLFILAHADRERCGLLPGSSGTGWDASDGQAAGDRRGQLRSICREHSEPMLDVDVARHALAGVASSRPNLPIFAPGPAELQAWEALLTERPDLQPALLRTPDGLAHRLDRLRGAGNGVCSLAAAVAWSTLKAAFAADIEWADRAGRSG